jgi:hypothetical protein
MAARLKGRLVREVEVNLGAVWSSRGWPARGTFRVEIGEDGVRARYGRGPWYSLSWAELLPNLSGEGVGRIERVEEQDDVGKNYRRWLVQYAIHVGVAIAAKRRAELQRGEVTLEEIRSEMDDLGLLDGVERAGDVWALDIVRLGPFTAGDQSGVYVLETGITPEDFPDPGQPPPTFDPPPVEEEPVVEQPRPKKGAK